MDVSFLKNIDLNDAITTIFSTFVGAWLAYKWAEKTQKGIETRAKREYEKQDLENKTFQLNYLNIFLRMHLSAFIELFQHLDLRLQMIGDALSNTKLTDEKIVMLLQPIADWHIDFNLDTHDLLFTADDEQFIQGLALIKTSLNNYYNAIQMLNINLKPLQASLVEHTLTKEHLGSLYQLIRFVIEEIAFAISTFYKMQEIIVRYNQQHDNLVLRETNPMNDTDKEIVSKANDIRKTVLQRSLRQKNVPK